MYLSPFLRTVSAVVRKMQRSNRAYLVIIVIAIGGLITLAMMGQGRTHLLQHLGYRLEQLRNSTSISINMNTSKNTSSGTSTSKPQPLDPCARANITLVTAFFDIGDHKKGGSATRHINSYLGMSQSLGYFHNPLVFYTDSQVFADHLTKLRSRLDPSLTHVILIRRDFLWPFSIRDPIAKLYSQPGYPKHAPNTVVPEYSCAQHAKYACILDVILKRKNITRSEVYAWVDFGYFRDLKNKKEYCTVLPKNFDREKPSFNQVFNPNFKQPMKNIFYRNQVWVGGGMFVATRDTMIKLCTEYQRASEFLLFKRNLSSTDQQTLYASFTEEGRRDVAFGVELQVDPGGHGWFQLGMSCLHKLPDSAKPTKPTTSKTVHA